MPTQTFFNLPAAKRQLILDLAIEEFAAHDYNEASISRVVLKAGIAKGSFYQYFTDKSDLYFYLLDLAAAEKNAFLQRDAAQDSDLFAYLRELFQSGLHFQFANPLLAQVIFRALYGNGPFNAEALTRMRQNSVGFFQQLVAEGMSRGELDPALDADLVAFLLHQIFIGLGDYLSQRADFSIAALAEGRGGEWDRPGYWALVDDLLLILQRGLGHRSP